MVICVNYTKDDDGNDDDRRFHGEVSWEIPNLLGFKQVMFMAVLLRVFKLLTHITNFPKGK